MAVGIIKKISEGKTQNRVTVPKDWDGYVWLHKVGPDKFLNKVIKSGK